MYKETSHKEMLKEMSYEETLKEMPYEETHEAMSYKKKERSCIKGTGNTKFWEILKIGWIVILYKFDIYLDAPVNAL